MAKKKAPHVNTAKSVLKELAIEVQKGAGKKRFNPKARAFLIRNAKRAVTIQLGKGDTWDKDKKNTLPVARKLGKIAAILANGQIILEWAARAAAEAAQQDPRCPGVARGGYCDF